MINLCHAISQPQTMPRACVVPLHLSKISKASAHLYGGDVPSVSLGSEMHCALNAVREIYLGNPGALKARQ